MSMGGLFASMAAGAAKGYGTNVVEQAKARREAALRSLELEREMSFRSGENRLDREARAAESAADRDQRAELAQKQLDEAERRDNLQEMRDKDKITRTIVDEHGNERPVRADGRVGDYKTEDGHQFTVPGATEKPPRKKTALEIEKMAVDATKSVYGDYGTTPDQFNAELDKTRERLNKLNDAGELSDTVGSASKEQIISEAREAIIRGADKDKVREILRQQNIDPVEAGL